MLPILTQAARKFYQPVSKSRALRSHLREVFCDAVFLSEGSVAGGLRDMTNQKVIGFKRGLMDSDQDRSLADEEDDSGPGGEERAMRCRDFRDFTGTTIPIADQYLQRNRWDLEQSVAEFFEDAASNKGTGNTGGTANNLGLIDLEEIEKVRPVYCQQFAELTETTEEYASSFLPGYNWDVQAAVSAFITDLPQATAPTKRSANASNTNLPAEENEESNESPTKRPKVATKIIPVQVEMEVAENSPSTSNSEEHAMEVPPDSNQDITKRPFFKIVSWNIDGLDDKNFDARALGVAEGIREECPDVVFLQEVVAKNLAKIESQLHGSYEFVTAPKADYFVAIMLHKSTVTLQKNMVVPFANTRMGRNLLCTEVVWKGIPFCLATAHLESTKDGATERVAQLRTCFEFIKKQKSDRIVMLGGDLNLRDPEVGLAGGLPNLTVDLWQACSSRPECKWTWDCKRNTNASQKCAGLTFMPQCRFDRLYYRPSEPSVRIKPVHFGLVGLKKAPRTQSFPSDHWGITCTFDPK